MGTPALPLDILFLIMDDVLPQSVSRMMRTCRSLYNGGARSLLDAGVVLETSKHVISFLLFMQAQPERRYIHFRTLDISRGQFSRRAVDALKGLISHQLLSLEALTMRDAEAILTSDVQSVLPSGVENTPQISLLEAFSQISTLKHLTISECDAHSLAFLRNLRSSLITASLGLDPFIASSWSHENDPDERNPIVFLPQSSHTLQVLTGRRFDIAPNIIKYDVTYPAVRRINATYLSNNMPATLAYINAFPNLEYLSLTMSPRSFGNSERSPSYIHRYDRKRSENADDQNMYRCTWEHLQEVSGRLIDLWVLGLKCRIPRVHILGDTEGAMYSLLAVVLDDVRPRMLSMTAVDITAFGAHNEMYTMLRTSSLQDLQKLELEVCLYGSVDYRDLDGILDDIVDTFIDLALRHLSLIMNYRPRLLSLDDFSPFPSNYISPLERQLEMLDVHAFAHRLLEASPSFTTVSVSLSNVHEGQTHPDASVSDDSASLGPSSDEDTGDEVADDFAAFMVDSDEDQFW